MKWHEFEDNTLTVLWNDGMKICDIARYYPNRTAEAVAHRARSIGLQSRKKQPRPENTVDASTDRIRYIAIDTAFCKHFEKVSPRRYDGRPL